MKKFVLVLILLLIIPTHALGIDSPSLLAAQGRLLEIKNQGEKLSEEELDLLLLKIGIEDIPVNRSLREIKKYYYLPADTSTERQL